MYVNLWLVTLQIVSTVTSIYVHALYFSLLMYVSYMAVLFDYCPSYATKSSQLVSPLKNKPNFSTSTRLQMHENEYNEKVSKSKETEQARLEEKKTYQKKSLRKVVPRKRYSSSTSSSSDSSDDNYSSTSKSTYTERSESEDTSGSDASISSQANKNEKKIPPALPLSKQEPDALSDVVKSADVICKDNSPPPLSPVEVPLDPRVWKAEHVAGWVKWMTKQFNIEPEPDITRFPTTGAELCTLSRAEFWVCAGSREGGILFAKHFALTLHSATGREMSPMLNDNEPSKFSRN